MNLSAIEWHFAYPAALLAPLVALLFCIWNLRSGAAGDTPSSGLLTSLPRSFRQRLRTPTLFAYGAITLIALSIAAARPQIVNRVSQPQERHNLMLALDISRSMATRDFMTSSGATTRIEGVKSVVADFLKARDDDRVGLVVFGADSYLQSPLTLDHTLLSQLARTLEVGIAGDGTAIGEGLGLALQRIKDIPGRSKAVILLTDGVNNSGTVNPLKAANVAKDLDITVHTIGIGSTEGSTLTVLGQRIPVGMAGGLEFDEKTLKEIAELTGGLYRNANSIEGLADVYAEIDQLERSKIDEPEQRIIEELFAPWALVGLIAGLLYLVFNRSILARLP